MPEFPIWAPSFAHPTLLLPWAQRICHQSRSQRDCGSDCTVSAEEVGGNLGFSRLQVHTAQQVLEVRVRAQRVEQQLILADSEHNSDGLNGSGDNPLAICVDLHPEAYVNPTHFAEAATECGPGQPCRS
jgi:hypothetical protein